MGSVADATESRMAASWKMPTMAAPRARASLIMATTMAALAGSSEAVGSSSSRTGCPAAKPRARFTRCCSPPEKVAGGKACRRAGMLSRSSSSVAWARASGSAAPRAMAGSATMARVGDARDGAEELADAADGVAADVEHDAGVGGGEVDEGAGVADEDAAVVDAVVCRAARAAGCSCRRRDGPVRAMHSPARDLERGAVEDGDAQAVLQMEGEGSSRAPRRAAWTSVMVRCPSGRVGALSTFLGWGASRGSEVEGRGCRRLRPRPRGCPGSRRGGVSSSAFE